MEERKNSSGYYQLKFTQREKEKYIERESEGERERKKGTQKEREIIKEREREKNERDIALKKKIWKKIETKKFIQIERNRGRESKIEKERL